ncbi:MAG: hypothetical protein R3B49_09215 [Phycisphaerales bacterium]
MLVTPERSGAAMDALCRYVERMATHAGRESAAATRDRATSKPTVWENGTASVFGWLDARQRRTRKLMLEIAGVFEQAGCRPGTRLVAASVLVRPVRSARRHDRRRT